MEYYSTKQIADLLNVSKQRVYRSIKSNCISEVHRDTVKGNTVLMYDKATVDRIKELLGVSDEVHHDTVNDTLYDTLLKQLEIKDNQIKELNERLKESQKALDQEQQLHLLSKQRILELETVVQADDEEEEEPQSDIEEQSKGKNFWQRFFHK